MANLYPLTTGVLKTGELTISKSVGSLIFTSSKQLESMTNETISMWIERPNGAYVYLATKQNFRDFAIACLSAQNNSVIDTLGWGNVIVIELGLDAGILLQDGEKLKIQMESLLAADTWEIDYVEDFANTLSYISFETKVMTAGERDKTFDCVEKELCVVKDAAGVSEIGIFYGNSGEKRFTPKELKILGIQSQEVAAVVAGGVKQSFSGVYALPLVGVDAIRIYSNGQNAVPVTFMQYDELIPASASKRSALLKAAR